MTKNQWEKVFVEVIQELRQQTFVPYDTGNLKYNAIKGIWVSKDTFRIYIDEDVAPYVFFTNEPWVKRAGQNPNEGWVDKMVGHIAQRISQKLKGKLTKK